MTPCIPFIPLGTSRGKGNQLRQNLVPAFLFFFVRGGGLFAVCFVYLFVCLFCIIQINSLRLLTGMLCILTSSCAISCSNIFAHAVSSIKNDFSLYQSKFILHANVFSTQLLDTSQLESALCSHVSIYIMLTGLAPRMGCMFPEGKDGVCFCITAGHRVLYRAVS